jgi:hypothetical protein
MYCLRVRRKWTLATAAAAAARASLKSVAVTDRRILVERPFYSAFFSSSILLQRSALLSVTDILHCCSQGSRGWGEFAITAASCGAVRASIVVEQFRGNPPAPQLPSHRSRLQHSEPALVGYTDGALCILQISRAQIPRALQRGHRAQGQTGVTTHPHTSYLCSGKSRILPLPYSREAT